MGEKVYQNRLCLSLFKFALSFTVFVPCFIASLNLYRIVICRMFRHFDEEIIMEYYECIDNERKVDVL